MHVSNISKQTIKSFSPSGGFISKKSFHMVLSPYRYLLYHVRMKITYKMAIFFIFRKGIGAWMQCALGLSGSGVAKL